MNDSKRGPVLEALETGKPGTRSYVRLPITQTIGEELAVGVHVAKGASEGPTLTIISVVHGDEAGTISMLKRFLETLELSQMKGAVVLIPVANPFALATFTRVSLEQHGNNDLHQVFPGNPKGSLTQMLAKVLTEEVLVHSDAFIDLHSGGLGGRLQRRVDFHNDLEEPLRGKTLALCRSFGSLLVHANLLKGTASLWLNGRGVPTINIELGGAYLSPADRQLFEQQGLKGLEGVMLHLGMVGRTAASAPAKQLLFDRKSRIEVNPTVGGYLSSNFERQADLETRIEAGTLLGEVLNPYTLDIIEELRAPVSGRLFFSRYSGMAEGGTKAFGIAREETSTWLE